MLRSTRLFSRRHSQSSQQWLRRQHTDSFVQEAKKDGYRARSAYKLLALNRRFKLFRKCTTIVDLGAAPGSWLQVARAAAPQARILGCDLLAIAPIADVQCIQGDFEDQAVQAQIINTLQIVTIDLVLSDLAPNMRGLGDADQASAMRLAESVLAFATCYGAVGSSLLIKLFMGLGIEEFVAECKQKYRTIHRCKPAASRAQSKEFYLYARQLKPRQVW